LKKKQIDNLEEEIIKLFNLLDLDGNKELTFEEFANKLIFLFKGNKV
jgi:Ca2+-binding EF-hand superfamily protein